MSRVILHKHDDGSVHVVVGWDHPAHGAFWQEWASSEELSEAKRRVDEAIARSVGPSYEDEMLLETDVKREGGMWPGISLDRLRDSMPEELRFLVTDSVLELLKRHRDDPDSGYHARPIDLS